MPRVTDDAVQISPSRAGPWNAGTGVEEYVAAGAIRPILYLLGDDVPPMIDAFATRKGNMT
jgi:hypothetical protein